MRAAVTQKQTLVIHIWQFADTQVKGRHSKNCVPAAENRHSSALFTGSCSIRLSYFWIYQAKDRRSRVCVCRWLARGDKRGICPSFKTRHWKRIWRMADASPEVHRLSKFLFSQGLNNHIFSFLIARSDLVIITRFPDTL
jgi:hypothetical protein